MCWLVGTARTRPSQECPNDLTQSKPGLILKTGVISGILASYSMGWRGGGVSFQGIGTLLKGTLAVLQLHCMILMHPNDNKSQ